MLQRILEIQRLIQINALASGRSEDAVSLLAVSKGQSEASIIEAYSNGVRNFGENYLQEAILKQTSLKAYPIIWHFIGRIQSNKVKSIAKHFDWVHTLSRYDIALKLQTELLALGRTMNVCIQVNLEGEATKSGLSESEIDEFIIYLQTLSQLKLRGFMLIPSINQSSIKNFEDEKREYELFKHLALLLSKSNERFNMTMDTLSMGMSDDFCVAIRAGSTIVRIGRAIFGDRIC